MAEFFARKTADVIVKETGLGIHVVCLFCVSKFTIHSRCKSSIYSVMEQDIAPW